MEKKFIPKKIEVYGRLDKLKGLADFAFLKDYPKGKKITVIAPHSDDVSIACGGAVFALKDFNEVQPVLFFTGYRGVDNMERETAIKIREREMAKESRVLGVREPIFLQLACYDDSSEGVIEKDIIRLKEVFEKIKPDIIFLPKIDDLHHRHRLASRLTLKALKFPVELFFYEDPWSLFKPPEINAVFFLQKKEVNAKLKAIKAHNSQLQRTAFDRAAMALAEFRGVILPEQIIFGYGGNNHKYSKFHIEAFHHSIFRLGLT